MTQYCVFICLVLCIAHINADVSLDYFYGPPALRSDIDDTNCENDYHVYLCHSNCPRNHLCFMENCMCIDIDAGYGRHQLVQKLRFLDKRSQPEQQNPPGFVDLTKSDFAKDSDDYYPSQALRHHIAHFCPNLNIARECIRKCMQLGKPAFCGKDHVCYCGHTYNHTPANDKVDTKAMYAQFKDLYKKYFGTSYHVHDSSEEHHKFTQ